ncbi:hypothetical protein MMC12_005418 [Toensbergia leucococca]|nr:hypothetical protein [Toensbergia leucococca]
MSDAPPQLGDIPQRSEMTVPTLKSNADYGTNGNSSVQNVKDTMYSSEVSIPAESGLVNPIADRWLSFSPVAENVKNQHAKTTSEFQDLADSRTTPSQSAATGQPLTHYHSLFYNLLSWKNPRATSLSFLATVLFIFSARYLPALRLSFKFISYILGAVATAEILGKLVLSQGLATSFRPKKYYTIPREFLESSLEDVEQLINFFVIESQRILFAENIMSTVAAFFAAVVSYWLIKIVPFWGLSLIAISTVFLTPLIYMTNKELIDHHVNNASQVVNSQASQVKDLAGHHTARATETVRAYAGDYSAKAQNYIGSARGRSTSPEISSGSMASSNPIKSEAGVPPSYSSSDFPHAPKQEPTPGVTSHAEQYENSQFGGQAESAM